MKICVTSFIDDPFLDDDEFCLRYFGRYDSTNVQNSRKRLFSDSGKLANT